MSPTPINLGVTGLSVSGYWFSRAHLPYISKSPHYRIVALQNSSKESADKAVQEYNLDPSTATYGDSQSLASDPNVHLVVVSVKVPHHYELAKPALEAGKDVFVEWPLAKNLKEAEELTSLAKSKGVRNIVGLQARQNPSIRKAKSMIAAGELGKITSTTMLGSGMIFGPVMSTDLEYALPIENGANLLTIPFGHAIDALCYVLGEWDSLSATLAKSRETITIIDSHGKPHEAAYTSPDQIAVQGTLSSGGLASVAYGPGTSRTGKNFYWEINGTQGSLVLEAATGHVQMSHPTLSFISAGEGAKPQPIKVEEAKELSDNVGIAWEKLAGRGEGSVTTFDDALVRHKMIDTIYRSAERGTREKYI